MELILWRHAEAEPHGFSADKDRKLTPLGQKQAKKMAAFLKQKLPKDTLLLSSPAVRCQQTISALKLPYKTSEKLSIDASPLDLLDLVDWHNDSFHRQTVLICGHQPILGQTIAKILMGSSDYWTIKKGSIWWLSSKAKRQDSHAWIKAVLTCDLLESRQSIKEPKSVKTTKILKTPKALA